MFPLLYLGHQLELLSIPGGPLITDPLCVERQGETSGLSNATEFNGMLPQYGGAAFPGAPKMVLNTRIWAFVVPFLVHTPLWVVCSNRDTTRCPTPAKTPSRRPVCPSNPTAGTPHPAHRHTGRGHLVEKTNSPVPCVSFLG